MKRIFLFSDTIKISSPYIQEIVDHEYVKKFSTGIFYFFSHTLLKVDY